MVVKKGVAGVNEPHTTLFACFGAPLVLCRAKDAWARGARSHMQLDAAAANPKAFSMIRKNRNASKMYYGSILPADHALGAVVSIL